MKKEIQLKPSRVYAASLLLRVVLGLVIFAHGAQKMLGWFGGHGYDWTLNAWKSWFNFPEFIIHLVIWGEFFAPIFLILGIFSRYAAGVVALIMVGAIYFVHAPWGFFMNWYMQPNIGEGFEYHLLVLCISGGVFLLGDGKYSLTYKYLSLLKDKNADN